MADYQLIMSEYSDFVFKLQIFLCRHNLYLKLLKIKYWNYKQKHFGNYFLKRTIEIRFKYMGWKYYEIFYYYGISKCRIIN